MKTNKIARLILLALLLFVHCDICAQEHQIKTYIHHRIVWTGNSEIQQWNAGDTVFIVDTCFSISTVCQIYGDTLICNYPFDDSDRIVFILKHGGKYYHTNATTISDGYKIAINESLEEDFYISSIVVKYTCGY
jgi:hypothetical protein